MKESQLNVLKKLWPKPISILLAFAFLAIAYLLAVLNLESASAKACWLLAIPYSIIWLTYGIACVCAYSLPRTPKNQRSVLFCIDAESPKLFASAKSKLVSVFAASQTHNSTPRLKALCGSKERIAKYDLTQDADCLRLLQRTGAVILVDVQYKTDDVDDSETFILKINYGVRHPKLNETAEKALTYDMSQLGSPLRDRRFAKQELIDVFEFSAQALVFVCQYIIGFVLLLADDCKNAKEFLTQARSTAIKNDGKGFDTKRLIEIVDDRLYAAYNQIARALIREFQDNNTTKSLRAAEKILEQANSIRPNTYSYNLLKAYILVMLYQDCTAARKCINLCKQSHTDKSWTFSDAFLCAYAGNTAGHIISKYNKAFKSAEQNLIELAHYIELVHSNEPDKNSLHLAMGILYCRIGDNKLCRYHLSKYLELENNGNSKSIDKVNQLIQAADCNVPCDYDCSSCCNPELL